MCVNQSGAESPLDSDFCPACVGLARCSHELAAFKQCGARSATCRGYQREAAGAVAALLLVAAANLATPQLIRVAIDVGFTQAQPSVLAETVAGLVALAFAQFRDSPDGLSAA